MNDLISRQAALDMIDAIFPVDPTKSEYAQGIACGAALAKTYIKQLPSTQPESRREWYMKGYRDAQPRWIPCSERNPDKDGRYLITGKMGTVYSLDLEDGRWYGGIKPIAWCELPEPYKEGQDEQAD